MKWYWGEYGTVTHPGDQRRIFGQLTFALKSEGQAEVRRSGGKNFPGRENSMCKGPEAEELKEVG